jgi:hypothetical protein
MEEQLPGSGESTTEGVGSFEERGLSPEAEDDEGPEAMDISLVRPPPLNAANQEKRVFQYPNKAPFYFGMDITHEVCGWG